MDTSVLVESDREEGARLLQAVDQEGIPVSGALWYYNPLSDSWRYMLSTPLMDTNGPAEVYRRIDTILRKSTPSITISLDRIAVIGDKDNPILELRLFAGTQGKPFIGGTWIKKSSIGEIFIDNAYVYRSEQIPGWTGALPMEFAVLPADDTKTWQRRMGTMTVKDGFTTKVEIDGHTLRSSASKNGVNAVYYIFQNSTERGGRQSADVVRMKVLDGRLRSMEVVAVGIDYPPEITQSQPAGTSP
jgi:hypothetical protein